MMTHYNQFTFTQEQMLDRLPHEPTQEEIKAMCAEIRKKWSPATRRSRRVINNDSPIVAEVNGLWIPEEIPCPPEMPRNSWE